MDSISHAAVKTGKGKFSVALIPAMPKLTALGFKGKSDSILELD